MDVPLSRAIGTLRFSTGSDTREEDIDRLLDVLPGIVEQARVVSGVAAS